MNTEKLTDEQMRVKIAEAMGWEYHPGCVGPSSVVVNPWRRPKPLRYEAHPPDYLNDLGAMHEAEKTLTEEQCCKYQDYLTDTKTKEALTSSAPVFPCACFWFHATARQRAIAFLRCLP